MSTDKSTDWSRQEQLKKIIAEYLEAETTRKDLNRENLVQQHPDFTKELKAFFVDSVKQHQSAKPIVTESTMPTRPTNDVASATTLPPTKTVKKTDDEAPPPATKNCYFGDYELLEEIARGGMGVVYKARQVSLKRIVALKMILAGQLASPQDVQRLYTEAEAAANLDHVGIVPIVEVGEHDGQHYFSMGFVEGESLACYVADGPLPPREAAELTKQICDAIAYAHNKGVIHRDLKPANILLDKNGQPKVTDFGIAKKIEGGSELTGTGQILGTPAFMPPEQASGKTAEIGPLADIYSLGAILYNLLTGRPPFQAANPLDTLIHVLDQEPVAPQQLNPAVDKDLETICLKCLQKEPERRYSTAKELADDLQRALNDEPIDARPVGRIEKIWLWCRRKPALAGSIAAILLVSVVATVVVTVQKRAIDNLRAEKLIEYVVNAPAAAVPYAIRAVAQQRNIAIPILQKRFEDKDSEPAHRLFLALALAEFGQVQHEFLVTSIATAPPGECANIVDALNNARDSAIKTLHESAKDAESKQDWKHSARLAIVALHLDESSIAQDMCHSRPDSVQRSTFIETLRYWRGDLAALAKLVEANDDSEFCSAICRAVGGIPVDSIATQEQRVWQEVLTDWYQTQPDEKTRIAAGWALRQWKLALPETGSSTEPIEVETGTLTR